MEYRQILHKRNRRRSGRPRLELLAIEDGHIVASESVSSAKMLHPTEVLEAMARLQGKILNEKAAAMPPK